MALTAIQVKEAKSHGKDLKISDGEGMYLLVKVTAASHSTDTTTPSPLEAAHD